MESQPKLLDSLVPSDRSRRRSTQIFAEGRRNQAHRDERNEHQPFDPFCVCVCEDLRDLRLPLSVWAIRALSERH